MIVNIGDGPFETRSSRLAGDPTMGVNQRIYNSAGGYRVLRHDRDREVLRRRARPLACPGCRPLRALCDQRQGPRPAAGTRKSASASSTRTPAATLSCRATVGPLFQYQASGRRNNCTGRQESGSRGAAPVGWRSEPRDLAACCPGEYSPAGDGRSDLPDPLESALRPTATGPESGFPEFRRAGPGRRVTWRGVRSDESGSRPGLGPAEPRRVSSRHAPRRRHREHEYHHRAVQGRSADRDSPRGDARAGERR